MGGNKDVLGMRYPTDTQYLASPVTQEGREELKTFTRRRAGVDRWEMLGRVSILLINCAVTIKNAE